MTGIAAWVCPSQEPKVIGQLRIAIEMLRTGTSSPDEAAAAHLVSTAMKLPPRYGMPIAAAVSGQVVAEHDLELAARALELALGRAPSAIIAIREARETVESFSRGPLSASGGGDADRYADARREAARLLRRLDCLPMSARVVVDRFLAGAPFDAGELLEAVDTLEREVVDGAMPSSALRLLPTPLSRSGLHPPPCEACEGGQDDRGDKPRARA